MPMQRLRVGSLPAGSTAQSDQLMCEHLWAARLTAEDCEWRPWAMGSDQRLDTGRSGLLTFRRGPREFMLISGYRVEYESHSSRLLKLGRDDGVSHSSQAYAAPGEINMTERMQDARAICFDRGPNL